MPPEGDFAGRGWATLAPDPALGAWAEAVRPPAARLVHDHRDRWLRCGGTWFAGVNILPNGPDGAVPGGPPLPPALCARIAALSAIDRWAWEPAQVSVCYPGYPRPGDEESAAAARYRRDRDGAHVDGLLPEGPARRRHLRERHGFVLGVPLTATDAGAAPFVVWDGSHAVMRAAIAAAFAGVSPAQWGEVDVTDAYHAARRTCFGSCARIALHVRPGGAYLVHRLALHGVAPWAPGATAPPEGRMIAYFRPEPPRAIDDPWWLGA